jgi:hypothetical protein
LIGGKPSIGIGRGNGVTGEWRGAALALLTACGFALAATWPAGAQTPEDLGHSLTPFGAIRAGNANGTIPAWDGGTTKAPAGFVPGKPLVDPYANEKPLFAITAANVDRYEAKLTPGIIAKLRTLPGYRLDIYPTHRNFAAPDYIYQAAIANARSAKLANGGIDVEGAKLSIPFPIPTEGSQVIWNHLLRWRGAQVRRTDTHAVVNTDGSYGLSKTFVKILFAYNLPGASTQNINDYFYAEVLAPPRSAGGMDITLDYTDPFEEPRQSWFYTPGERRVRRAPKVGYDTPIGDTDGIETVDDLDLFNGALDRYDWKLIGRREMYVPYNCYAIQQANHPYSDILRPGFINPDLVRWELHRVWVVDAAVRAGNHHIYARRTSYVDEDSWQMLISDRYDSRGLLWRTGMAFPVLRYDVPVLTADGYEYTDLLSHRYFAVGLHGPERQQPDYGPPALSPAEFTPEALRDSGKR